LKVEYKVYVEDNDDDNESTDGEALASNDTNPANEGDGSADDDAVSSSNKSTGVSKTTNMKKYLALANQQ
ncbi:unnamed protein product, partial [Symbiodinium microadriaticum]